MDKDLGASSRKKDHIELAFQSRIAKDNLDDRFYYEPLLAAHPSQNKDVSFTFLDKIMRAPLWVSSMTGGTELAGVINKNLAKAAHDFGFGMGLGSCRSLLFSNEYFEDFNVRDIIGDDLPLYANLGIAQVEQLFKQNKQFLIPELIKKLRTDGMIIHINPFQEWLQPEGDRFIDPPLVTLNKVLDSYPDMKLIVKEVGHGMGPESLKALFKLPLSAVEFAANGGTNFSRLELLRSDEDKRAYYAGLANIGHSAMQMVQMTNNIVESLGDNCICKEIIVSGGILDFLDGFYLINKLSSSAIYGQASAFLKYARQDYDALYKFVTAQVEGLRLAKNFLKVR